MANQAALIRAENAGLPVTKRGRRFIEFDLGNGNTRHVATIERMHLADNETEIDATWVADTGAWQWKLASADFQAHARSVFNVGNIYEWRKGSEWIIVDPQSINWVNQDYSRQQIAIKQPITGTVDDCKLSFSNAYGTGIHFDYIAHPQRLVKHITIDSVGVLPTPTVSGTVHFEAEWTVSTSSGIDFWLDGVKWEKVNGVRVKTANRIEFRDTANTETLWYADAPQAWDAAGNIVDCEYEVRRDGGPSSLFITVRVPKDWLLSATFPVVVDPTFTDGYGGDVNTAFDVYLKGDLPDDDFDGYTDLWFRNPADSNTWARMPSIIKFNLSSLSGVTITSRSLYFYIDVDTWWDDTNVARVSRILSANSYITEVATWNHQDGLGGGHRWAGDASSDGGADAGGSQAGTDHATTDLGTFSFGTSGTKTAGTQLLFSLGATEFASMVSGNYGIYMYSTGYYGSVASSDNATTGYRPKLVVEYTSAATDSTLQVRKTRPKSVDQRRAFAFF